MSISDRTGTGSLGRKALTIRGSWVQTGVFFSLLALQFVYILSLQAFPTQDGPVHVYYSSVIGDLLAGGNTFGWFFYLKNAFPPYAFSTYLLVFLNQFVDPLLSEKILVCAYTACFCLGFRYVVHAIATEGRVLALLCFPLSFNHLLYMGFYNFCYGVAVTLWLVGYWTRHCPAMRPQHGIVVCALVFLLLAMHPVALLVALMILWVHLVLTVAVDYFEQRPELGELWTRFRPALLTAIIACAPLVWVAAFTERRNLRGPSFAYWFDRLPHMVSFADVCPFRPLLYHALFAAGAYAVIILIAVNAYQASAGERLRMVKASSLLLCALFCLIAFMILPAFANASGYFPQRFLLFGLIFILAYSGVVRLQEAGRWVSTALIAGVSLLSLTLELRASGKIVETWTPLISGPPGDGRLIELTSESQDSSIDPTGTLKFRPHWWAGAHYARRSRAVLLNTPWLDLPIAMLGAKVQSSPGCIDPEERAHCLMSFRAESLPVDIIINTRGAGEAGDAGKAIASSYNLCLVPSSNSVFSIYRRRSEALDEKKIALPEAAVP